LELIYNYCKFKDFEVSFEADSKEHKLVYGFNDLETYKRKVEQYLKEQSNHITISKVRSNILITKDELNELERMLFEQGTIGDKENFTEAYGQQSFEQIYREYLGYGYQRGETYL